MAANRNFSPQTEGALEHSDLEVDMMSDMEDETESSSSKGLVHTQWSVWPLVAAVMLTLSPPCSRPSGCLGGELENLSAAHYWPQQDGLQDSANI